MKEDVKGLYLAVLLSALAMFLVNRYLGSNVQPQPDRPAIETADVDTVAQHNNQNIKKATEKELSVADALSQDSRVDIANDVIRGSIRLKGARFDNIRLTKYKQTLEENSPDVELFKPSATKNPYYMQFGWLNAGDNKIVTPDENTLWTLKGGSLTVDNDVSLEWTNGQGIRFINKISLDKHYMFHIKQIVENNTNNEISLYPYALITKNMADVVSNTRVVHEGMIGVFNDTLEEVRYDSMKDIGDKKTYESKRSWAGFSDHYWFSALIFNDNKVRNVAFKHTSTDTFQVDYLSPLTNIVAGSSAVNEFSLYAGAKEIKLLDDYVKNDNISKFDLAVDFGWYYFLTKPFFYILNFLYNLIGNMGWAILLFAALLRLCMFPIANKSFESMSKMRKFQPKIKDLQERYKDDKLRLQQEMMALYKKEKINPASGCLPMFIQIPVFFSLYKVLNISIEIRHAPFIGWIKDLSAPDPLVLSEWLHIYVPSFLNIGIWPILMGITMFLQQRLNPAPTSKDQARMFMLMPLIFTFMLGHFASGLVIYWTLSNVLGLIQQKAIMHKNGVK